MSFDRASFSSKLPELLIVISINFGILKATLNECNITFDSNSHIKCQSKPQEKDGDKVDKKPSSLNS